MACNHKGTGRMAYTGEPAVCGTCGKVPKPPRKPRATPAPADTPTLSGVMVAVPTDRPPRRCDTCGRLVSDCVQGANACEAYALGPPAGYTRAMAAAVALAAAEHRAPEYTGASWAGLGVAAKLAPDPGAALLAALVVGFVFRTEAEAEQAEAGHKATEAWAQAWADAVVCIAEVYPDLPGARDILESCGML